MEIYDYYESVEDDLRSFIKKWISSRPDCDDEREPDFDYLYDLFEQLRGDAEDKVTGYYDKTFTHDPKQAKANLLGNQLLLIEASKKNNYTMPQLQKLGPEFCDALIRYYVVDKIFDDVLEEVLIERGEYIEGCRCEAAEAQLERLREM